jgi:uncharacterized protein YndB with AHSA1/START domain
MLSRFARSLTILMLGLTLVTFLGGRAHAVDSIEPDLEAQKSSMEKDGTLRLELSASMNAPVAKVYGALTNPDKLSKYSADITSAKVLSSSATGKVVEYQGATDLNPNKKPFVVNFTFDPGKQTITAQSAAKAAIKFRADYVLSPSKDGKSTAISYVSVSADPSKALGMEAPEFMRKLAGIQTFMKTLISAGKYIQDGGK